MTPVELSRTVLDAVRRAVADGELAVSVPAEVKVARPRPGGTGDYASNVALQLAKGTAHQPRAVADAIRRRVLDSAPQVAAVDITGPGFLNFTLGGDGAQEAVVRDVLAAGRRYGHVTGDWTGRAVSLHFPCEVRAAVVADTVRRILLSQRVAVRATCAAAPDPAWTEVLGVQVDAHSPPADSGLRPLVTPVPAPAGADPLLLGRDAARWALLYPAAHHRPDPGGATHLAQRESNPLFRVRYAHSRALALVRNAHDLGFSSAPGELGFSAEPGDPGFSSLPGGTPATPLLTALTAYPALLAALSTDYAPDRLCRHLVVTADAFFRFHDATRVLPLGPEKPSAAHRARLALAEAAGTVLAGGLSLLGIDAPVHL